MNNCQSCGLPLEEGKHSKHDNRYCVYCQDQDSGKLKTYDEVKAGSVKAAMDLMGKSQKEAEKLADEMLPKLPRWMASLESVKNLD